MGRVSTEVTGNSGKFDILSRNFSLVNDVKFN